MNFKLFAIVALFVVALGCVAEAHKKFYNQPNYGGGQPECYCDCNRPNNRPILPSPSYIGNGGYHQSPPSHSIGYGHTNAVTQTYGHGGGQVNGGY